MKFPRWLSWLFLLFLAYMIYAGNQSAWEQKRAAEQNVAEPAVASTPYPALEALTNGERWKRALNPEYKTPEAPCGPRVPEPGTLANYAIVDQAGSGSGAACGETIPVKITYWDAHGHAAQTVETTLVLTEQKSLDALLIGMAPGEIRTVILRPPTTYASLPGLKKDIQQSLTVERLVPPAEPTATDSDENH